MIYSVSSNNIHIKDSYLIRSKKEMKKALLEISEKYPNLDILMNVSIKTLIREWRSHNLLYELGLFKDRTKDVDLNENPLYLKIGYYILSLIYYLF